MEVREQLQQMAEARSGTYDADHYLCATESQWRRL
jgi:hypothetical protein